MLTDNQDISGVKTFTQNIIANISGNATSVTGGLTTSSEITDLSGMTSMGSGKIITTDERDVINNLSGININANYTEMRIVGENVPLVDNFIIKKTSQFYNFLS